MKRHLPPQHPFLAAIFPVVTLYAENVEEEVRVGNLIGPLAISLGVAAIGWLVAGLLTRERSRRGLLVFVWVLFCFWYGPFALTLDKVLDLGADAHLLLLPWACLVIGVASWIIRTNRSFTTFGRFLNLATLIILLFPLSELARSWARDASSSIHRLPLRTKVYPDEISKPDIYFIILDKYSSPASLMENYNLNIQPFLDSLRIQDFFIPEHSHANYIHTHLSLASMLNWTHLDEIARAAGINSSDRSVSYELIETNRAWRYLKNLDYKFIFFPTTFPATLKNRFADRELVTPIDASTRLQLAWFLQTPIAAAVLVFCEMADCVDIGKRRFPYLPETADQIEQKFIRLEQLAKEPGPKFVVVHLLVPHEPYIFRADCSHREPLWPRGDRGSNEVLVREAYAEQIICLNRKLLRLVSALLEGRDSPIILLQSDHGHGRMSIDPLNNRTVPLEDLHSSQITERARVFAAYHLPKGGNQWLYDTMTPVNLFPIILNYYFGAGIAPREDATYWSETRRPYALTRLPLDSLSSED